MLLWDGSYIDENILNEINIYEIKEEEEEKHKKSYMKKYLLVYNKKEYLCNIIASKDLLIPFMDEIFHYFDLQKYGTHYYLKKDQIYVIIKRGLNFNEGVSLNNVPKDIYTNNIHVKLKIKILKCYFILFMFSCFKQCINSVSFKTKIVFKKTISEPDSQRGVHKGSGFNENINVDIFYKIKNFKNFYPKDKKLNIIGFDVNLLENYLFTGLCYENVYQELLENFLSQSQKEELNDVEQDQYISTLIYFFTLNVEKIMERISQGSKITTLWSYYDVFKIRVNNICKQFFLI